MYLLIARTVLFFCVLYGLLFHTLRRKIRAVRNFDDYLTPLVIMGCVMSWSENCGREKFERRYLADGVLLFTAVAIGHIFVVYFLLSLNELPHCLFAKPKTSIGDFSDSATS